MSEKFDVRQELRAMGVRFHIRAGIPGQVHDTIVMRGTGDWTPEFSRKVAEVLTRAGNA